MEMTNKKKEQVTGRTFKNVPFYIMVWVYVI